MASMRNWLQREEEHEDKAEEMKKRRVAVVHCKAGKGRSGTVACSYLISQEGWKKAEALRRFTERRMRAGFGEGVSIPSQLRYVGYVDRWTNDMQKQYIERPVEILELHVWGLRDGVKVTIEGYIEDGRQIKAFHTFTREEKIIVEDGKSTAKQHYSASESSHESEAWKQGKNRTEGTQSISQPSFTFTGPGGKTDGTSQMENEAESTPGSSTSWLGSYAPSSSISTVLFKPKSPLILPTSDVNVDFERRNSANYTGWTVVTSLAHVWWNAYFEGGHEGANSGVFEIDWEAMDGIKGSAKKGIKALDRLKVVWRYAQQEGGPLEKLITEPAKGEFIHEPEAADWKGVHDKDEEAQAKHADGVTSGRPGGSALTMGATIAVGTESLTKELGLRKQEPESANVSRANSIKNGHVEPFKPGKEIKEDEESDEDEGVRVVGPEGEDHIRVDDEDEHKDSDEIEGRQDTKVGKNFESGMGRMAHVISKMKGDHGAK